MTTKTYSDLVKEQYAKTTKEGGINAAFLLFKLLNGEELRLGALEEEEEAYNALKEIGYPHYITEEDRIAIFSPLHLKCQQIEL